MTITDLCFLKGNENRRLFVFFFRDPTTHPHTNTKRHRSVPRNGSDLSEMNILLYKGEMSEFEQVLPRTLPPTFGMFLSDKSLSIFVFVWGWLEGARKSSRLSAETKKFIFVPFKASLCQFGTLLKLNAQFSKFTSANDFSHFMDNFMNSLSTVKECQRVVFNWFMASFSLLPSKEMDKALQIAVKINKQKISNPFIRSRVPLTRQFPKPLKPLKMKPKEVYRPPLNIFEVPDDVLSKIFSSLSQKQWIISQKVCRHFAIIANRPSSVGFPLEIDMSRLPSNGEWTARNKSKWWRLLRSSDIHLNYDNLESEKTRFEFSQLFYGRMKKHLSKLSINHWSLEDIPEYPRMYPNLEDLSIRVLVPRVSHAQAPLISSKKPAISRFLKPYAFGILHTLSLFDLEPFWKFIPPILDKIKSLRTLSIELLEVEMSQIAFKGNEDRPFELRE